MVAAAFEDVDEAVEVGVHIVMRMLDRMTHAGLGREMHHNGKFFRRKQRGRRSAVGEIELDETKPLVARELLEARLLERRIVIRRKTVDADDRAAVREQSARHMKANK